MYLRLSLLMFLEFAIMGAWSPVLAPHLKQLFFTPHEASWVFATNALGALLGPIVWGQIADRWLAAERCISLCCAVSGACLWLVADWTAPADVFWGCLVFWLFMIPSLSVASSLTFRHLPHPDREFGKVRLWGTVGWIVAGFTLTAWYFFKDWLGESRVENDWADALRLGALVAWANMVYAWFLPHTPPAPRTADGRSLGWLGAVFGAPLAALQLFRHRSFGVLCACLFGVYVTWPFNAQLTPLLLEDRGVPANWLPTLLTLAQSLELMMLWLLPNILVRLGQKGTMVAGMSAWTLALALFTLALPGPVLAAALPLHGVFICCFLVAGQLYVNRLASHDVRASAQGLIQLINGLGLLTGNLLVGGVRAWANDEYAWVFAPAALLACGLLAAFAAGFEATRSGS